MEHQLSIRFLLNILVPLDNFIPNDRICYILKFNMNIPNCHSCDYKLKYHIFHIDLKYIQ